MAYSLKNVMNQKPEMIKNTITAVLVVVVFVVGNDPSLLEAAGVGFAIEKVLDLFYVEPIRQAENEKQALVAFEKVRLETAEAIHRPLRAKPPESK